MYIEPTHAGYLPDGTYVVRRALFLIMVQPDEPYPTRPEPEPRAIVRKVALQSSGPWMIGKARAFGHTLHLSGSYGNDGLPLTVPRAVFDNAVPIPPELVDAWNKGGGWNGAGSEADLFRKWARQKLEHLTPISKRKR